MHHSEAEIMKAVLASLLFCAVVLSAAPKSGYWSYWRGPTANGMAVGDAPVHWSDTQNIKWQADIPGRGYSSPVIWGDKIFVTTAIKIGVSTTPEPAPAKPAPGAKPPLVASGPQVEHKFDVLCLDRKTGKTIWQRTATTAVPHEGYHSQYGSFASNSPVTDGKNIYAFFGSRGIYCYNMKGQLIWQKNFDVKMKMRMAFGEGMAPVISGDRLILVFDYEGDSFMVVLDKNSGKEIWRVARDEKSNWAAPLVYEFSGSKQILVAGNNKVRSYDFANGKVIWECAGLGANVIPHPVLQDDMVFVMSGFINPNLMAIKLGRQGDITGTDAVVWSQTKGNSYTPSPVLYDNKLYVLTDNGMISCYNAKTGVPYYQQQRLPKTYSFKSSLVGANGKLYLASENEDVIVLRMGEKFEVLATNTLADQMYIATPAIMDGEIFLRGQNKLFCIHEK
jgi:outer membrane protein assembly factor BamB